MFLFRLIALALEQFIPYLSENWIYSKGKVDLKIVAGYIQKYLLPAKKSAQIYRHLVACKQSGSQSNPIKYYFENKKAPFTVQVYTPLNVLGVAPPKCRKKDVLPYQWQEYITKEYTEHQVKKS